MLGPTAGSADTRLAHPIHASKKPGTGRALARREPGGAPATPDQKKLAQACKDFESVMLGIVFKQMSAASGGADMLAQGAASKQWREMLDEERAKSMANSGGIGLADSIYRQLADRV